MKAEWKKEVTDKLGGHTYDSGMAERKAEPTTATTESETAPADTNNKAPASSKAESFCNTCKFYGHQRKSSKLCRANPKSRYYVGTEGTCVRFVLAVYCALLSKYSYLASEHTRTNLP